MHPRVAIAHPFPLPFLVPFLRPTHFFSTRASPSPSDPNYRQFLRETRKDSDWQTNIRISELKHQHARTVWMDQNGQQHEVKRSSSKLRKERDMRRRGYSVGSRMDMGQLVASVSSPQDSRTTPTAAPIPPRSQPPTESRRPVHPPPLPFFALPSGAVPDPPPIRPSSITGQRWHDFQDTDRLAHSERRRAYDPGSRAFKAQPSRPLYASSYVGTPLSPHFHTYPLPATPDPPLLPTSDEHTQKWKYPYSVPRTRAGMLPVYHVRDRFGMLNYTYVRDVWGDPKALQADLITSVFVPLGLTSDRLKPHIEGSTRPEYTPMQEKMKESTGTSVRVLGHWRGHIVRWLVERGF